MRLCEKFKSYNMFNEVNQLRPQVQDWFDAELIKHMNIFHPHVLLSSGFSIHSRSLTFRRYPVLSGDLPLLPPPLPWAAQIRTGCKIITFNHWSSADCVLNSVYQRCGPSLSLQQAKVCMICINTGLLNSGPKQNQNSTNWTLRLQSLWIHIR